MPDSPVQTSLVHEVPERVERWELHAYEDPEGEVYVAYSAEALAAHLCADMSHGELGHEFCYKADAFSELAPNAVLENEETGERVVIAEALAVIEKRVSEDATHDPKTAGMVDQLWTYYA